MTINTDKKPNIHDKGFAIQSHSGMGKIEWNPKKIELYISEKQKMGYINGNDLRKELKRKPVLNATVLDWLLEHPKEIPKAWKEKYVYFWGTIFRDADGNLCVKFLYWDGGGWNWGYGWLVNVWRGSDPAASLAVSSDTKEVSTDVALEPLALRVEELEKKMEKIEKFFRLD